MFPNWWNRWRLRAVMYSLDGNNDLQTFTLYPGIWDHQGRRNKAAGNAEARGTPCGGGRARGLRRAVGAVTSPHSARKRVPGSETQLRESKA